MTNHRTSDDKTWWGRWGKRVIFTAAVLAASSVICAAVVRAWYWTPISVRGDLDREVQARISADIVEARARVIADSLVSLGQARDSAKLDAILDAVRRIGPRRRYTPGP